MTEEENIVQNLLLDFFKQRYNWEYSAYKELERLKQTGENGLSVFKDFKPQLEKIYAEFLTEKERKYTLSYNNIGSEPYFDPKFERIDTVTTKSKSKIIIHTTMDRNNSEQKNEYVFSKKAGIWKLDNKKTFWDFKGKWESTML